MENITIPSSACSLCMEAPLLEVSTTTFEDHYIKREFTFTLSYKAAKPDRFKVNDLFNINIVGIKQNRNGVIEKTKRSGEEAQGVFIVSNVGIDGVIDMEAMSEITMTLK